MKSDTSPEGHKKTTAAKPAATEPTAAKSPVKSLTPQDKGRMIVDARVNAAAVVESYQGNILGSDADLDVTIHRLEVMIEAVQNGNLKHLEAMLVSQAVSLQTLSTSLARRASKGTYHCHAQAYLGLALKAQAQSRATISAIVDLKHPRQATFVKQANIAQGPQQVNNGVEAAPSRAHGEKVPTPPNKLLEQNHGQCSSGLDAGASQAPERGHQAVEAVGAIDRSQEPRG